jgi:hypothetical protein
VQAAFVGAETDAPDSRVAAGRWKTSSQVSASTPVNVMVFAVPEGVVV